MSFATLLKTAEDKLAALGLAHIAGVDAKSLKELALEAAKHQLELAGTKAKGDALQNLVHAAQSFITAGDLNHATYALQQAMTHASPEMQAQIQAALAAVSKKLTASAPAAPVAAKPAPAPVAAKVAAPKAAPAPAPAPKPAAEASKPVETVKAATGDKL